MRDCRIYLPGVKGDQAATVNADLAPIRAIVPAQGRTLKVRGVKQVQASVETLDARDLGQHGESDQTRWNRITQTGVQC